MEKKKKTTASPKIVACPECYKNGLEKGLKLIVKDKYGDYYKQPYMFCGTCLWFQRL